jgi:peptide chain release factor 3
MSQRREAVDEAYAGDIIGFTIHGGVQLGDSITDGPNLQFTGLPFFAPEMFRPWCSRTRCAPSSCSKPDAAGRGRRDSGLQARCRRQYAAGRRGSAAVRSGAAPPQDRVRLRRPPEGCQYTGARWITADSPAELREFENAYPMRLAHDAADTLAYLCTSPYDVRLAQERFPKIHFHPLREHAGLALGSAN